MSENPTVGPHQSAPEPDALIAVRVDLTNVWHDPRPGSVLTSSTEGVLARFTLCGLSLAHLTGSSPLSLVPTHNLCPTCWEDTHA